MAAIQLQTCILFPKIKNSITSTGVESSYSHNSKLSGNHHQMVMLALCLSRILDYQVEKPGRRFALLATAISRRQLVIGMQGIDILFCTHREIIVSSEVNQRESLRNHNLSIQDMRTTGAMQCKCSCGTELAIPLWNPMRACFFCWFAVNRACDSTARISICK